MGLLFMWLKYTMCVCIDWRWISQVGTTFYVAQLYNVWMYKFKMDFTKGLHFMLPNYTICRGLIWKWISSRGLLSILLNFTRCIRQTNFKMEFIKGLSNYIMCMNNFKKDFTNGTIFLCFLIIQGVEKHVIILVTLKYLNWKLNRYNLPVLLGSHCIALWSV